MLPDVIKSPVPAAPVKMSYNCSMTMSKKQMREMRQIFYPLTRPAHISPKKKVSWRLIKKWFNRYEKPVWLKRTVMAVSKDGKTRIQAKITSVKIHKAGGRKRDYSFTATPI